MADASPAASVSRVDAYVADAGRTSTMHWMLAAIGIAAIVLFRGILIARLGSDTPFWDQWDSEIAGLYKPFVDGTLGFWSFFAPHNEHRILFSRVFNLILFSANGNQFDNQVETLANAVLYAGVLMLCAWPVLKRCTGPALLLAWLLVVVAGISPYGWENLDSGFQNAFFFMNAGAAIGLASASFSETARSRIAAIFAAFASLFTLASGLLLAPALAAIWLLRWYRSELPAAAAIAGIAAAAAVAGFGILILTPVAGHAVLETQGALDYFGALLSALSWPMPRNLVFAALLWWPSIEVARRAVLRRRVEAIDVYLLGLCVWVLLQSAAVAWARGHEMFVVSSRYTDTLAIGVLANAALGVRLLAAAHDGAKRRLLVAATAVAALFMVVGLVAHGARGGVTLVKRAKNAEQARTAIRAFLAGQGSAAFEGKQPREISYPLPARLAALLDDPSVRAMMPSSVAPPLASPPQRCFGFEHPGVPAHVAPLLDALGSHVDGSGAGECSGRIPNASRPYLLMRVAGQPGDPGVSLTILTSDGRTVATAEPFMGAGWAPFVFAARGNLQWQAQDLNTEAWIAFTPPVEVGRLTMLAQSLITWLRVPLILG